MEEEGVLHSLSMYESRLGFQSFWQLLECFMEHIRYMCQGLKIRSPLAGTIR